MRRWRFLQSPDMWAVVLLAAFPFLYFWQVTVAQGVWFTSDIISIYHPFGVELGRSLSQGRLPLWAPGVLAGFPLVAEGHVSAFYPVYLLLFRLLPAHFALSYGMLLHMAWAGIGMYACARTLGFRPASALLAGLAFSLNGYTLEKLYHTPILVTSAWLPWLICLQHRFQTSRMKGQGRAGGWLFLAAFAFALQLVAGFPQTALLSAIALFCFGVFAELTLSPKQPGASENAAILKSSRGAALVRALPRLVRATFWTALPIVVGVGIAAIQLVPTIELVGFSVRNQALSSSYLTEYSFPLEFLSQFVLPFAQGEPTEHTNEYWAYFGLAPFVFAFLAPILRRDRRTVFTTLFALGALVLAFGNLNPIYGLIERLPVFSLFRTPARYVLLFLFAAGLLAATGFEEISNRLPAAPLGKRGKGIAVVFGALTIGTIGLAQVQPIEFWLQAWQLLPFLIGLLLVTALIVARKRGWPAANFGAFVIGLTFADLAAYAPPFLHTLAALTPPSYVESVPRSVPLLQNGRVYTDLSLVPTLPAMRGSLMPNTAMVFGKASVHANSPLIFARHEALLSHLSPAMLNALNCRYILLPLEPRFMDRTSAPSQALGLDVLDNEIQIQPTPARSILVSSYIDQPGEIGIGVPVAEVIVRLDNGIARAFPLRFGIETDDWDFDRANANGAVGRDHPRVAHNYTGFVRSFGRTFQAHSFLASFTLGSEAETRKVVSIAVHSLVPKGRLNIERVSLINEQGEETSLAALSFRNDFQLAYMSDTVAVWENRDVLPRASIVHSGQVLDDAATLARMQSPEWQPDQTVLLNEGPPLQESLSTGRGRDVVTITQDTPERVQLAADTDRPGYLVLADSWYPGWAATVDGRPAPIYRADLVLRAVLLEPGEHTVVFEFDPISLRLGAIVSLVSLLLALGGVVAVSRIEV